MGWVGAVLVVLIGGTALFLEMRVGGRTSALIERVSTSAVDPLEMVAVAGRAHRLLFLGDVRGSARSRRMAVEALDTLVRSSGLDAVLVEVDPAAQPWIDRYLETEPEDARPLLERPRTLGANDGPRSTLLGVYRRIWQLNRELDVTQRIRIVAADAEGWPPAAAISPAQAVRRFAERDNAMFEALSRLLDRDPFARVLIITDGLHVLRGTLRLQTGGTPTAEFRPVAALAAERFPGEVFSILVDTPPAGSIAPIVAAYRGTTAGEMLRRSGAGPTRFGLHIDATFGNAAEMLVVTTAPGMNFSLAVPEAPLALLADGYIFLGSTEET